MFSRTCPTWAARKAGVFGARAMCWAQPSDLLWVGALGRGSRRGNHLERRCCQGSMQESVSTGKPAPQASPSANRVSLQQQSFLLTGESQDIKHTGLGCPFFFKSASSWKYGFQQPQHQPPLFSSGCSCLPKCLPYSLSPETFFKCCVEHL